MRWTLISLLCIFVISSATGQKQVFSNRVEGQSHINIGLNEVNKKFTPPSIELPQLKSTTISQNNINVTYVGFPEEAKIAFDYAISIWGQYIGSSVPIYVLAKWEDIQENMLAYSRPAEFFRNFEAAPLNDVYYPVALAEKISGKEWNNSKEADIICNFSSSASWYYGTDGNTPVESYDFVTVVLHEVGHGLGISGFFTTENGLGKIDNPDSSPSAYDYYIYNLGKQRISDKAIFTSPSVELHTQLTSNSLTFGTYANIESEIYAPAVWKSGISIYHLKNSDPDFNELMNPYIYKGEANHNPGENTLKALSEMGWKSNLFVAQEIKDVEETSEELPVSIKINSDLNLDSASVQIIFSTDNFVTKDTAEFHFNTTNLSFEAALPIDNYKGTVQYYFLANTVSKETVMQPKQAPENVLSFRIGPDYYSPELKHNPANLVSSLNPVIDFYAVASDNLGIGSVKVEYKINGIEQESFQLKGNDLNIYSGDLDFPVGISKNDRVEYRIIAEDNSYRKNKKILPEQGFYQIEVFELHEPVRSYDCDFNTIHNDFTITDFNIGTLSGFNNGILHTSHPYPTSQLEGEKFNMIAQLNHPIILEENGEMTFDEIVLVEPGELGTSYTDEQFWDYVIVEASNDNGESWQPLVDGYDSGIMESWETRFTNTLKSNASSAAGNESMFIGNRIDLTDNEYFSAGDTVIVRFRLSSDKSVNGWGWAIDNLKIQSISTNANEFFAEKGVHIYPNPCRNNLTIDCIGLVQSSSVEVNITDLYGKTVYNDTRYDVLFNPRIRVDLTGISSGIYIANIKDSKYNLFTQKIIKN